MVWKHRLLTRQIEMYAKQYEHRLSTYRQVSPQIIPTVTNPSHHKLLSVN